MTSGNEFMLPGPQTHDARASKPRTFVVHQGTSAALQEAGVKSERVLKIQEGRPNASDLLKNGEICMMLLTTTGASLEPADMHTFCACSLAARTRIQHACTSLSAHGPA